MFYSPKNYEELKPLLTNKDEKTFFIAGGTDLLIKLQNLRITDYDIIDLTKIKEWNGIEEFEEYIKIGSLTTVSDLCNSEIIKEYFPSIYKSAYELGSEIIRNTATIGGNICNASQSADILIALYSLGAKLEIANSKGEKNIIEISDFIVGKNNISLRLDEVLSAILVSKQSKYNYFKKVGSRKAVTISKINCGAVFDIKHDTIFDSKIYLGAVGTTPQRAILLEEYFKNKNIKNLDLEKTKELASNEIERLIPNRASKAYKKVAVTGLIVDILEELKNYERL